MARTKTQTASWGVSDSVATGITNIVSGVVTDFDETAENVLAQEQNEIGSTIGQILYDQHFTANMTIQVAAGTEKPDAGAQITIGGKQYYVTSSRVTENNTSFRKIAVTAERYTYCNSVTNASGYSASGS